MAAHWRTAFSYANSDDYKGIFALGRSGELNLEKVASLPFVDGICLRSKWNKICPSEGEINIDYFNEGLDLAAKYNKKVTLWVTPGAATPQWVYSKGAEFVEVNNRGKYKKIPIPWNKYYLKMWFDFISKFAKKIKNNPHLKTVVVTVAHFKSIEFHLPKELRRLRRFSFDTILGIWKDAIDHFALQFPQQFLTTHSTMGILKNKTIPDEICLYGARVYGGRFGTQMNNLREYTKINTLKRLQRLSHEMPVGLQAAGYFGPGKRGGDLSKALELGFNSANARYFELYGPNIFTINHKSVLNSFSIKLTSA